jgi:uncharacterized protein
MTEMAQKIWSNEDFKKITLFTIFAFCLFIIPSIVLAKFFELNKHLLIIVINFGLVLSILSVYYVQAKNSKFDSTALGFGDIKNRWLFYSFLIAVLVMIVGGGLSFLLAKLLNLNSSDINLVNKLTSDSLWLNLIHLKLFIALLIPIAEEVYFRGVLFRYLRGNSSFIRAGLISSLVFSLIHFSLATIPFTFILGFACAYVYEKSQSIYSSFLVHIAVNSFAINSLIFSTLLG